MTKKKPTAKAVITKSPAKPVNKGSVATPESAAKITRRNLVWNGFLQGDVKSLIYAVLQCALTVTLCAVIWGWTPERYFIATNNAYQIIEPTPLDQPLPDTKAIQYAGDATKEFLRISRVGVLDDLNSAFQKRFTDRGTKSTAQGLLDSGNYQLLTTGRYDTFWVSGNEVPVITSRRLVDGVYTWRIEVRGDWRWHDIVTGITHSNPTLATVFLRREHEMVKPQGMAIDGLVTEKLE